MIPIAEAQNPSTTYTDYDEERIKRVPIIDPRHAAKATEEDGPFFGTFIENTGNLWDIIYSLLNVRDAWPHVKNARNNHNGWKAMPAFYGRFWGKKCVSPSEAGRYEAPEPNVRRGKKELQFLYICDCAQVATHFLRRFNQPWLQCIG